MKNILLILAIILLGCTKSSEELNNNIPPELIGKWKVVEIYSADGGSPASWSLIKNGFSYIFFENKKVIRDNLQADCIEGNFTIENDNIIYFTFSCISYESLIENLTNNELIIDTQNFEPLKYKFLKIID